MPQAAPPTAARQVYDHVKARLLSGAIEENELLSEGAIAAEVGTSRTPVREAMVLLQAEGFLRLYPKRGAFVLPITAQQARDLMDARLLIEGRGLRALGSAATDLGAVDDALAAQQAALTAIDLAAFVRADRAMHRAFVAATGNAVLLELYDGLHDRQERVMHATVGRDPNEALNAHDQHLAIVQALRGGDPDRALDLLEAHFQQTLR